MVRKTYKVVAREFSYHRGEDVYVNIVLTDIS